MNDHGYEFICVLCNLVMAKKGHFGVFLAASDLKQRETHCFTPLQEKVPLVKQMTLVCVKFAVFFFRY